jgi:cytochrome c peroxidase
VPGLRNISETFPYFHDGSVEKLNNALWIVAKLQLDKDLSENDVSLIIKFLESTNGTLPSATKKPPVELAQNM